MEWFYNNRYHRVFNKFKVYSVSPMGTIWVFDNKEYKTYDGDIPCSKDEAVEKLSQYYEKFMNQKINETESELNKLENSKLKTLLEIRRGGLLDD